MLCGVPLRNSSGRPDDWALAVRKFGKGEIYVCQVPLAGRLDARQQGQYDPVAERLMAFLIEGQAPDLVAERKGTD